ncbi:MAG: 4-alpha-glucanotransferase [Saprospiraceae bacterium]|nr:4-alpha-glucanotransferase [Saprospiraceae bacterium]
MIANFHINYGTKKGEQIAIQFNRNGVEEIIICQSYDATNWHAAVQVDDNETITYKYFVQSFKGLLAEHGAMRPLTIPKGLTQAFYQDAWRAEYELERAFFSAAFQDVIFKRNHASESISKTSSANRLVLQLFASAIPQHLSFGIVGSSKALGEWKHPLSMSDKNFPLWQADIEIESNQVDFEYKFVIFDPKTNKIIEWERGENRSCSFTFPSVKNNALVRTDESFRYASALWRGAGVAIPVFSLRSEKGLGIGEFTDIPMLVDWATQTGMKLVQILPVNDTVATKTWVDSYPYAAISVYALHPYYVNLQAIAKLKDKAAAAQLEATTHVLNQLETVDYEQVSVNKFYYFKLLFEQEKKAFFKNKDVQTFIADNADWLKPYAAFCHLRDVNGTTQFHKWAQYSTFSPQVVADLCTPQYPQFDEIAVYYFIQYHAHKQLFEATNYARSKGVVLKGDLPIGIYRYSCDAWVAPHLYNMDGQAGAPPDAYAVAGQNWGFPTYNWDVMAQDNFAWWRKRMTKLSEYFDALRIDHILGFFRIWQIPIDQVEGTLGLFNPRLPYSRQELDVMGLRGNLDRYTQPYIRGHFLNEIFGEDADFVRQTFLDETSFSHFSLKSFVRTQAQIKEFFAENKDFSDKKHLAKGLMQLVGEVLLIEEPLSHGAFFNPRITVHTTRSYKELDDFGKYIIDRLYDDYFFHRHDEFWKQQALWKLPALIHATRMFICGEDLGMIPNSVPSVMQALNIIALEIQRMPKGATDFGETHKYPYPSVCSPSCHDMSTVRGWWESDYAMAQRFYNASLKRYGTAPHDCTPEIVEAINKQHLDAPSMWAIFPIQDLVGMNESLRRTNATAEQINEPANPQHYWRFRFHLPMEKLLLETELNGKIEKMVKLSGR